MLMKQIVLKEINVLIMGELGGQQRLEAIDVLITTQALALLLANSADRANTLKPLNSYSPFVCNIFEPILFHVFRLCWATVQLLYP